MKAWIENLKGMVMQVIKRDKNNIHAIDVFNLVIEIYRLEEIKEKAKEVVRKTKYDDEPWTTWIDILERIIAKYEETK